VLDNKRRESTTLHGAAVTWPLAARAQKPGKIASFGILTMEAWPPIDTFRQALNGLGYVEGKNVCFEQRYARGRYERFPELAHDLVSFSVGSNRSAE
jgi:putative ABC transport system substrate-binding protein